jgi:hypothetical protein
MALFVASGDIVIWRYQAKVFLFNLPFPQYRRFAMFLLVAQWWHWWAYVFGKLQVRLAIMFYLLSSSISIYIIHIYSSFARDVTAAMLVDVNKNIFVKFFCLWHQHGRHVFVFKFSWEWLQTKTRMTHCDVIHCYVKCQPEIDWLVKQSKAMCNIYCEFWLTY